jgi:UDP-3-O-[3-hydroxymyristoyl] glucosamine N-acyltransferase
VTAEGGRQITAGELAALTGGQLLGSADVAVDGLAALDRAGASDLSFLVTRRYLPYFQQSRAAVVLCKPEFADEQGGPACRVVVADPQVALLAVLPMLYPEPAWTPGVHPTAVIGRHTAWEEPVAIGPYVVLGDGVRLGRSVRIGAGCVLGDGVVVGNDVRLHPQVVCYSGTVLGDRVIVHAGARLGSDGFGYIPGESGAAARKIPQIGRCIVGEDVEIGANTTIDRGSVDDTTIGAGTKIDNLVQVAHNVRIGARCLIASQVGIAGSVQLEDDVMVAGQAGVGDHRRVGRGAQLTGGASVYGDIEAEATVSGYPARPHREFLRAQAALYRLAPIIDQIEALTRAADEFPGQ